MAYSVPGCFNMKDLIFVFLIFSLLVGGFIIQMEIGAYDFSAWNFTGSGIASGFMAWSGVFIMLSGVGLIIIKVREKK